MLRHARRLCCSVLIVASSLPASNPPQLNEVTAKVAAEVVRLRELAAEQMPSEEGWKDLEPAVNRLLTRAEDGVRTGRVLAATEDVAKVRVYMEAFAGSRVSSEAATMPAFEAAWKKASVELTAMDASANKRAWAGKPTVQQALAESAQGQSLTTVEASRAYATVTNTNAGYYYLGEARADADVASFVYSLTLPSEGKRFPLRSWLPELQGLQKKVNEGFVPPKSIDRHSDFIRVNSAIKLARDLDSSKLYAGALYQYLTAVQLFAAMNADVPNAAKQAELRRGLEEWKIRLRQSKRDDSLAKMFVERAELWINHGDGSEVNADQWKAATSVLKAVLPAYEQALSAVPPMEKESKKLVTVTLVRWPYT